MTKVLFILILSIFVIFVTASRIRRFVSCKMPRNLMCCVGNCHNSRQDAILYKIPIGEKRLKKWLQCLSVVCDVENLTPGISVVCKRHFESKYITTKSRLISEAYPSLFTDDEMTTGKPSLQRVENVDIHAEHSYAQKEHCDHSYTILESEGMRITTDTHPTPGCSRKLNTLKTANPLESRTPIIHKESDNPKQTKSRQRLVNKVHELTPLCNRIYKEYKKAKLQLSVKKRGQNAIKFCKETSFEKLTQKMNPNAKSFFKMQINLCTQKKNARRYTTEEKMIALSIMKQGPKCYRFLSKIFILPSKSTLNAMIAQLIIEPGINPKVFNLLKKEVDTWDPKKKICSLMFDEISLDTALTYDKHKDNINGFVELQEKKNNFADHALVFMLRGAVYKWQQPICFYFCEGSTPAIEVKNILKHLVDAVVKLGLNPIALISDQGAAFCSALNSLKEETRQKQISLNQNPDDTVIISGVNLNVIYDPSHLIKGIRNNFLTKNIIMDGKISKWQDIIDVYETDSQHADIRLLHKLNDQCVIPDKIKKMKVKNCVRVLSRTMSAALSYTSNFSTYVDGRPVSQTLRNTAEVVSFFDELFDSVNGSTTNSQKSKGKELRKAMTEITKHQEFWQNAIVKLKKIKFIDNKGCAKSVPSLKNFVTTLESFMRLWQYFRKNNIKIMRPRYFNSDPIENFFGQVRAYNYRYNDLNCHNFSCTYKSLMLTKLIKFHNNNFNCEDDKTNQAINLKILFEAEDELSEKNRNDIENVIEQARRERMNVHSRAYTAGWVVGKLLNSVNCRECQDSLTSRESLGIHDWISQREFTEAQKKRLKYPSEGAVRCFSTIIKESNAFLEDNAHQTMISHKIKNHIMSKYVFDFINCEEHKVDVLNSFISVVVRFTLMNWCSTINKILKGTDIVRLINRQPLPNMQQKAINKYKKKIKNKSFNK